MDDDRFDRLAILSSRLFSRRGVLAALAAALLGAERAASAERRGRGRGRKPDAPDPEDRQGGIRCVALGQRCGRIRVPCRGPNLPGRPPRRCFTTYRCCTSGTVCRGAICRYPTAPPCANWGESCAGRACCVNATCDRGGSTCVCQAGYGPDSPTPGAPPFVGAACVACLPPGSRCGTGVQCCSQACAQVSPKRACDGPNCPSCNPHAGEPNLCCINAGTCTSNCDCCGDLVCRDAHCRACGRIGEPCGDAADCCNGAACIDGGCADACRSGLTRCGSGCTDLLTDPANCGSCGAACPTGNCRGGKCCRPDGDACPNACPRGGYCDACCVEVCRQDGTCGLLPPAPPPPPPPPCATDGEACPSGCAAGAACTGCCSGRCGTAGCGVDAPCVPYAGICTDTSQCCNNVDCTSGRCRYP